MENLKDYFDSKTRRITFMDILKIEFPEDKRVHLGKCIYCGGESYVSIGGNVIMVSCNTKHSKFRCSFNEKDKCPGMNFCRNIESFDEKEIKSRYNIMTEIIFKMMRRFKTIVVMVTPETRKIIGDTFLPNSVYTIDLYGEDAASVEYLVVSEDSEIMERQSSNENLEVLWSMLGTTCQEDAIGELMALIDERTRLVELLMRFHKRGDPDWLLHAVENLLIDGEG